MELEAQLAQQEEVALMKEQQYASLDQEVKGTKSKLMRLQKKLQVLLLLSCRRTTFTSMLVIKQVHYMQKL